MPTLDQSQFQSVYTQVSDDKTTTYTVYRPLGNPMILFSEVDGSPLASLRLSAQETVTQTGEFKGRALITNRPDKTTDNLQMFQGLIDRTGQEIQLSITNLSNKGRINFNILRTDQKVTMVDPGGLNQVNELRPYETYHVKSDQNANNASLVLNSVVHTQVDQKTGVEKRVKVTLKQDEDNADTNENGAEGTYFYLSVVPEMGNEELQNRFAKTYWATASLILVRSPYTAPRPSRWGYGRLRRVNRYPNQYLGGAGIDLGGAAGAGGAGANLLNVAHDVVGAVYQDTDTPSDDDDLEADEEEDSDTEEEYPAAVMHNRDNMVNRGRPRPRYMRKRGAKGMKKKKGRMRKSTTESFLTTTDVLDTTAAKLGHGRLITVNSAFTGAEYDYDRPSSRCVLGLSVADNINFAMVGSSPSMEEMVADAKELVKEVAEGKYIDWLQTTKLYKAEECIICMDDEERLDCVFYTCGHQCSSMECAEMVSKCPLCRSYISVKLNLNDLDQSADSSADGEVVLPAVSVDPTA